MTTSLTLELSSNFVCPMVIHFWARLNYSNLSFEYSSFIFSRVQELRYPFKFCMYFCFTKVHGSSWFCYLPHYFNILSVEYFTDFFVYFPSVVDFLHRHCVVSILFWLALAVGFIIRCVMCVLCKSYCLAISWVSILFHALCAGNGLCSGDNCCVLLGDMYV